MTCCLRRRIATRGARVVGSSAIPRSIAQEAGVRWVDRAGRSGFMRVEMHCHSTASDGVDPPAEVGRQAAAGGLSLFCLTDHDTCAGCGEAASAFGSGGTTLGGVEVSAVESGRTVHLLVYDAARGPGWAALGARLIDQASARRGRMRDML